MLLWVVLTKPSQLGSKVEGLFLAATRCSLFPVVALCLAALPELEAVVVAALLAQVTERKTPTCCR